MPSAARSVAEKFGSSAVTPPCPPLRITPTNGSVPSCVRPRRGHAPSFSFSPPRTSSWKSFDSSVVVVSTRRTRAHTHRARPSRSRLPLQSRRRPWRAVAFVLVFGLAVFGGILAFVVNQFVERRTATRRAGPPEASRAPATGSSTDPPNSAAISSTGPMTPSPRHCAPPGSADQRGAVHRGHHRRNPRRRIPSAVRPHLLFCSAAAASGTSSPESSPRSTGPGSTRAGARLPLLAGYARAPRSSPSSTPSRSAVARHHGHSPRAAARLADLPRRVHPRRRRLGHRFPRRDRGTAGQGIHLRAHHVWSHRRGHATGRRTCCSRW